MKILEQWARGNGVTLFDDPAKPTIRTFYISKDYETLQLVFEEQGDRFRVDVWSVETENDEELHHVQFINRFNFAQELDRLMQEVRAWFSTRKL